MAKFHRTPTAIYVDANQDRLRAKLNNYFALASKRAVNAVKGKLGKADVSSDDRKIIEQIISELDIEGISVDMVDMLTPDMVRAFKEAGIFGVTQVGMDAGHFEAVISTAAMEYAESRGGHLIKDFVDTTKERLQETITDSIRQGQSSDVLASRLETEGAFGAARAEMIARTELAFAYTQGNVQGWRESGVVQGKQWLLGDLHAIEDECDECADAGVIPFDDEFMDGISWPPAHPNCVCACIPITQMPESGDEGDEE